MGKKTHLTRIWALIVTQELVIADSRSLQAELGFRKDWFTHATTALMLEHLFDKTCAGLLRCVHPT